MDFLKLIWIEFLTFFNIRTRIKIKNTLRCDLKCPYCCVTVGGGRQAEYEELTAQEWLNIVDNFPQRVGIVILLGGEPFFRKDSVELIDGLTARGVIVKVLSNCTYKRMLDVRRTPLVKYVITYHHHVPYDKWSPLYNQVKKHYRVQLLEFGEKFFPESRLLKILDESAMQYTKREYIFSPNGQLFMCMQDVFDQRGKQCKFPWNFGDKIVSHNQLSDKFRLLIVNNIKSRLSKWGSKIGFGIK